MRKVKGRLISADKITPIAFAMLTRGFQGVIIKSWAQLALELQKRFDLARKEKNRVQKENGIQKMKAKKLLPRKENVSYILGEFLDI